MPSKGENKPTNLPDVNGIHREGGVGKKKKKSKSRKKRSSFSQLVRDGRPVVDVTPDEHLVNAAAAAALATAPGVFQRSGLLVRLVTRDTGPSIEPLVPASLRETLTSVCQFRKTRVTENAATEFHSHPPGWCVGGVFSRNTWPGVSELDAVVEYPVLTPAGTLLVTPGYDRGTKLFLAPAGVVEFVPVKPSADEIKTALAAIEDIVCDFPFVSAAHKAAFVAGLLTPLARFAFDGPAPLFFIDANTRGAGKSLLAEIVGRIILGGPMTVSTFTPDNDELRKRITAHAINGDRLVLLDNITGQVRSPILDAALTSITWQDRVLGVNKIITVPLKMVWYATANNGQLYPDTARRACMIRLESELENPELRSGFRHEDLRRYASENRPRLLASLLTVLRGFVVAGKPDQKLPAWGSFGGWSDLVRNAVVWGGLADPGETRLAISESDPTTEALGVLMRAWEQADPHRHGLTAGEFVARLTKKDQPPEPWVDDAKAAMDQLVGRYDARALGNNLKHHRRRNVNGRFFDRAGDYKNSVRWAVYPLSDFSTDRIQSHQTNHTHHVAGESGESNSSTSDPQDQSVLDMLASQAASSPE